MKSSAIFLHLMGLMMIALVASSSSVAHAQERFWAGESLGTLKEHPINDLPLSGATMWVRHFAPYQFDFALLRQGRCYVLNTASPRRVLDQPILDGDRFFATGDLRALAAKVNLPVVTGQEALRLLRLEEQQRVWGNIQVTNPAHGDALFLADMAAAKQPFNEGDAILKFVLPFHDVILVFYTLANSQTLGKIPQLNIKEARGHDFTVYRLSGNEFVKIGTIDKLFPPFIRVMDLEDGKRQGMYSLIPSVRGRPPVTRYLEWSAGALKETKVNTVESPAKDPLTLAIVEYARSHKVAVERIPME